jgi:GH24 family phage-related lysozyme (muramidase)
MAVAVLVGALLVGPRDVAGSGTALRLSASTIGAGGQVTVTGTGWPCSSSATVIAFVAGISPYAPVTVAHATPSRGRFSFVWKTPHVVDTLSWQVLASEVCSGRTVRVAATVRIVAPTTVLATAIRRVALAAETGATTIDFAGLQYIADREGFVPHLYNDQFDHCTIGYGHLVHLGLCDGRASEAPFANGISPAQGVTLLQTDANAMAAAVAGHVSVPLSQAQLDALVSFTFSVGQGGFYGSLLRRYLNAGQYDQVPAQMARWNKGADPKTGKLVVSPGLVNRRAVEAKLWSTGEFPPVIHPLPSSQAQLEVKVDGFSFPTKDPLTGDPLADGYGNVRIQPPGTQITCTFGTDYHTCDSTVNLPTGTPVTLTAIPDLTNGSDFAGWSGDGTFDCPSTFFTCHVRAGEVTKMTVMFNAPVVKLTIDNELPAEGQIQESGLSNVGHTPEHIRCGLAVDDCTAYYPWTTAQTLPYSSGYAPLSVAQSGSHCDGSVCYYAYFVSGCDDVTVYSGRSICWYSMTRDRTIDVTWTVVPPA